MENPKTYLSINLLLQLKIERNIIFNNTNNKIGIYKITDIMNDNKDLTNFNLYGLSYL